MCTTCMTAICALFDALVLAYHREHPAPQEREQERYRPKVHPLTLSDSAEDETTKDGFKKMVDASTGIGYDPGEFMHALAKKSGYPDHVHNWARGILPNGLARKIILTCAEDLIRERGAAPTQTLRFAA